MTPLALSRRRIAALGAVVAVVTAMVLTLVVAKPSSAAQINVMIEHYQYSPAALSVHPGDTVTWMNMDDAPHTVTTSSGPEKISSPTLQKGDKFTFTFTKAGTYEYYCAVHPDMKASVTVTGGSGDSSGSPPQGQSPPPAGGNGSPDQHQTPPPSGNSSPPPPDHSNPPPSSTPPSSPSSPPPSNCQGELVVNAMADPFVAHMQHSHLEESPGQQAADLLDPNHYVLVHTALLEAMLNPLIVTGQASLQGGGPFVAHLDHAHLDESPAQQAGDLLNADSWVRTHTVLVEMMTSPATRSATGQC